MGLAPHRCLRLAALALALGLGEARAQAPAAAEEGPPVAEAVRSPDGRFTLRITAPVAWTGAELSVRGADAVDLGPAAAGEVLSLQGLLLGEGPLKVTLTVATSAREGITWQFEVDPIGVPTAAPELKRGKARGKSRRRR